MIPVNVNTYWLTYNYWDSQVKDQLQHSDLQTIIRRHLLKIMCCIVTNPSPGDNHQSTGGQSERTQCQAKISTWNSFSYILYQGSPLFPIFRELLGSFHRYFSVTQRPPSPHPSNLTLVYLVPVLHLLPPSTAFWQYGTHPFFSDVQTISILSDPPYLLTQFMFLISYAPLHS